MSVEIGSETQHLDITSSLGIDSDSTVLMACWGKWLSATGGHNSNSYITTMNSTTIESYMRVNGTPTLQGRYDTGSGFQIEQGSGSLTDDVWNHFAHAWGPADGSGQSHITWQNGTKNEDTGESTDSVSETFDVIRVGQDANAEGVFTWFKGRIAYLAIWSGLSEAQMDTIVAELQTTDPDAASIVPDLAWPLETGVTADRGGINFTNNGATFVSGDNPPLSGGGGGSIKSPTVIII